MPRDLNKVQRSLIRDKHFKKLKKKAFKRISEKKLGKIKPIIEKTDIEIAELETKIKNIKRQLAFIFDRIESETGTKREFIELKRSEAYRPTIERLEVEKVKLKQQLLDLQLKERDLLGIRTYGEIKAKEKKKQYKMKKI